MKVLELTIDSCDECNFYLCKRGLCIHPKFPPPGKPLTTKEYDESDFNIPEWCPLEDKEQ